MGFVTSTPAAVWINTANVIVAELQQRSLLMPFFLTLAFICCQCSSFHGCPGADQAGLCTGAQRRGGRGDGLCHADSPVN